MNEQLVCSFSLPFDNTTHCDEPNVLNQNCSTGLPGVCGTGITRCISGQVTCVATIMPGSVQEIPFNGLDDDCDCVIDNSNDDGSGNNPNNSTMGATETPIRGQAPFVYADGIGAMIDRGNARDASNNFSAMLAIPDSNSRRMSSFLWQWGQFVDHDIALIRDNTSDPFFIRVPAGDRFFDPQGTGNVTIPMFRSEFRDGVTSPRIPVSNITQWQDASNVYGSDPVRMLWLRTGTGGRMKMTPEGFLPRNADLLDNLTPDFFVAGDIRVNEQVGLMSMHTLWVREHNYWANRLQRSHPTWTDEMVYRLARLVVTAEIQHITYDEFLPALLGPFALAPYAGYDASIDARIMNEFSSAAFRIGHTLLNDQLLRLNEDGSAYARGHLSLRQAFFNVSELTQPGSFDAMMRGFAAQQANEIDMQVIDGVRNFLFGRPGAGGLDLVALNVQRGRDHGLPDYNTVRAAFGLPRRTTFDQITSNATIAAALQAFYGSIDNIDAFLGLLAEDHVFGASVGETHGVILRDQFRRLRDGDRNYYQNNAALVRDHPDLVSEVVRVTLAQVIQRNSNVRRIQPQVFFVPLQPRGQLTCCDRIDDPFLIAYP